jgi:hypothetical protein
MRSLVSRVKTWKIVRPKKGRFGEGEARDCPHPAGEGREMAAGLTFRFFTN